MPLRMSAELMTAIGWIMVVVGSGTIVTTAITQSARRIWASWGPEFLVRIGIASIFIVNGVVAFVQPDDFGDVLRGNLIGRHVPDALMTGMVLAAGVNDLALGAALLVSRNRRLLVAWMAIWLIVVASTKAMNLVW